MTKESSKITFDVDSFDAELTASLYEYCHKAYNCYHCGEEGAIRKCSGCKVAVYCNTECQKKDWKAQHKPECTNFRDNKQDGVCMPECFLSSLFIKEDLYRATVDRRWILFLTSDVDNFSLQVSIIYEMREVRIAVAVSFWHTEKEQVEQFGRFLMNPVDSGEEARKQISSGCGRVSSQAKKKAMEYLIELIEQTQHAGKKVGGITFGRGMMDFPDDPTFNKKLEDIGFKCMLLPSMDYAMQYSMQVAAEKSGLFQRS
jgi:hypothetical protein